MSPSTTDQIDELVRQAQQLAQDGKEALAELDPELPFVAASDVVDQELIFIDFEPRKGTFPEPFYSCRVVTPEGVAVRVAIGSPAIKQKLDKVAARLPLRFTIVEKKSDKGRRYFDLE